MSESSSSSSNSEHSIPKISTIKTDTTDPKDGTNSFQFKSFNLFNIKVDSLGEAPKLKGSSNHDYEDWKRIFQAWATSKGVARFIQTTAKDTYLQAIEYCNGSKMSGQLIQQHYRQLHERLYGIISLSIYDALGNNITDAISYEQRQADLENKSKPESKNNESFYEYNCNYLWLKTKETFEKKAAATTVDCLNELIHFRLNDKENPLQFKQRFEGILHKLNNIENDEIKHGQKLSEGTKFALLSRALPLKYNGVISTILTANTTPTIDHIFISLQRQHDNIITTQRQSNDKTNSALSATHGDTKQYNNSNYKGKKPYGNNQNQKSNYSNKNKQSNGDNKQGNHNNNNNGNNNNNKDSSLTSDVTSFPIITEQEDNILNSNKGNKQVLTEVSANHIADDKPTNINSEKEVLDLVTQAVAHVMRNLNVPQLATSDVRAGHLIIDSGSSRNLVFDKSILSNLKDVEPFYMVGVTGHRTKITQMGSIQLSEKVVINNVCYAPNTTHNLLSLACLLDAGAHVSKINKDLIQIKKISYGKTTNGPRTVLLNFERVKGTGLFRMKLPESTRQHTVQSKSYFGLIEPNSSSSSSSTTNSNSSSMNTSTSTNPTLSTQKNSDAAYAHSTLLTVEELPALTFYENEKNLAKLWHNRLGHLGKNVLDAMNQHHLLGISNKQLCELDNCTCDSCIYGKGRAKAIHKQIDDNYKPTKNLEIIYMDLIGWVSSWDGNHMNRVTTLGGNLYALNVVDGFSTVGEIRLLKFKSDAADAAMDLIKEWELQTGLSVKEVHTDGGGEFINHYFQTFLHEKGIKLTYTTRDHPTT